MKEKGLNLLRKMLGEKAEFREGQWESIESVLNCRKTLVVQKTGGLSFCFSIYL